MNKSNEEIYQSFLSLWNDLQTENSFPNKRPLLAHYTSIETLERIVASNEIWFSNPLYMNDQEELRFGINESLFAFQAHSAIKAACKSDKRHEILLSEFNDLYNIYGNEHVFDTYVFCLSEHDEGMPDGLLSMWRGYGSNGNGAAIIFDTSKMNHVDESPLIISHVTYASQEARKAWINKKLDEFANLLSVNSPPDEHLRVAAYAIFNRLKIASIFTKHHGFSEEREWRAVYLREFDPNKRLDEMLHYSIGRRGVEPKLKFKVQPVTNLTGPDLSLEKIIHKIILGPSLSSPLAMRSIKRMLEKNGKQQIVDRLFASTTPFRPH